MFGGDKQRCMPSIHISEEKRRELGRFGTRDESWDTIISRVLKYTDEEAVLEDLRNREREIENQLSNTSKRNWSRRTGGPHYSQEDGHPALKRLEDGTKVRHQFKQGEYAGEVAEARVRDGHIVYNSEWMSPSGAAEEAVKDIKSKSTSIDGWRWWDYLDSESNEWRSIDELRN